MYSTPGDENSPHHQDKERVAEPSRAGQAVIMLVSGEAPLGHEGTGRKGKKGLLYTNAYTGGKSR